MKYVLCFMLAVCSVSANTTTYDLQQYLPATTAVNKLSTTLNGAVDTQYTFTRNSNGYMSLYQGYQVQMNSPTTYPQYDANHNLTNASQMEPGELVSWGKSYLVNGGWCSPTTGILFLDYNKAVWEVGDWMSRNANGSTAGACTNNSAFGYKTGTNGVQNTGIVWAPPGGLVEGSDGLYSWFYSAGQNGPGTAYNTSNVVTYSRTKLIEHLVSYTVSGVTFNDVVHIVLYHGNGDGRNNTCNVNPSSVNGVTYTHIWGYSSYAVELYLAKNVGIIYEDLPYSEGGPYWGTENCLGSMMNQPGYKRYYHP